MLWNDPPNFATGKTEIIMDICGHNSTKTRRQFYNVNKGRIELSTNLPEPQTLQAVYKYRHLGGYITHGAKLRPEIQHRLAQGHQIMKDYQTKIFRNREVPLTHRLAIVKITALKAVLYNCGAWGRMTQHDAKIWNHGVVMLYRKAMTKLYPWQQLMHYTDNKVLCLAEALPPMMELRLARLRIYGQALQRHCPFYWTLLCMEQTWFELLQEDFVWLYLSCIRQAFARNICFDVFIMAPHWCASRGTKFQWD